jgi:hypothetical protein
MVASSAMILGHCLSLYRRVTDIIQCGALVCRSITTVFDAGCKYSLHGYIIPHTINIERLRSIPIDHSPCRIIPSTTDSNTTDPMMDIPEFSEEWPGEQNPPSGKGVDEEPIEEKSVDEKPVEEKPIEGMSFQDCLTRSIESTYNIALADPTRAQQIAHAMILDGVEVPSIAWITHLDATQDDLSKAIADVAIFIVAHCGPGFEDMQKDWRDIAKEHHLNTYSLSNAEVIERFHTALKTARELRRPALRSEE